MTLAVEQRELDQFASCYPTEIFNPKIEEGCTFTQIYVQQNRMLAVSVGRCTSDHSPRNMQSSIVPH